MKVFDWIKYQHLEVIKQLIKNKNMSIFIYLLMILSNTLDRICIFYQQFDE
jgi:hypothetical protein